jgi:hypothetical protein
VLQGIDRALRPDGIYLMQEIRASSQVNNNLEHPMGPWLYTISCLHCMTVSLSSGGMGLGTVWGREKAMEMLAEAGFGSVEIKEIDLDFVNDYYIVAYRNRIWYESAQADERLYGCGFNRRGFSKSTFLNAIAPIAPFVPRTHHHSSQK